MRTLKVCIDAGHGGHYPGAVSGGMEEEDFNLIIASMVACQLGDDFDVVMTRRDDKAVSLLQRSQIANDEECDLFVSIHANASFFKGSRGLEIFFYSRTGERVAEIIRNQIMIDFKNLNDRGTKRGQFVVLRMTDMPAVLIECAFMSNEENLKFLKSEGNQVRLAESITEGIKEVLNGGCLNATV